MSIAHGAVHMQMHVPFFAMVELQVLMKFLSMPHLVAHDL